MRRIRAAVEDEELVKEMPKAAFTAMAKGMRNHAAEFLSGGICAPEKLTPELYDRLSGMPVTSTAAERVFAVGRAHDKRAGASRDDTRTGVILGGMDNTVEFMEMRIDGEYEWAKLRKVARIGMKESMADKRLKAGLEERELREAKLKVHREKKAAKVAEVARLQAMLLATKLSELMTVNIAALRDQLKKHKLMGKKGSAVTQINRTAYALTLQTFLLQADPEANDLPNAESGIDGRIWGVF